MAEKNRFSKLLKHLLSVAEVKNYTLAQELQYDVSYISKWTSGQMIPVEKYEKKILEGISECVVNGCNEAALNKLLQDYQVDNREVLKRAILDNLEAECFYVRELQNNAGVDVAPKMFFFPEMKLTQYISKMRHPVLRRVNALDIVSILDIFSMKREYQLQVTEGKNKHVPKGKWYQDVRYSMMIDIQPEKLNYTYDIIFLVDLLERNSCIDFRLYGSMQAAGRAVFVVRDDYLISGMLVGADHCVSVVISEESENCKVMYRNLMALCNRDKLLFRKTTMKEMLRKHEYVHSLFALRQQWIMGHLTEHFLSEELFEEILGQLDKEIEGYPSADELRNIHRISRNIVEEFEIKLLMYRTAFYNLVVDNELDFFNCKVKLTPKQVVSYLEHFLELYKNHPRMEIRMISGRLIFDIEYSTRSCIFLSDTISYLRLNEAYNNEYIINRNDMREAFGKMFYEFWEKKTDALIIEKEIIIANIEHTMGGILGSGGEENSF